MSPTLALISLGLLTVAVLLSGLPVGLALAAAGLAVVGLSAAVSAAMTGQLSWSALEAYQVLPDRLLDGIAFNQTLLAIPLFLLMGSLLQSSRLIEDVLRPLGRQSRALPPSVVAVGGILGASSGVVGASVTALGLMTLPALLKRGLSASAASGLVAAAGALGQVVPPSIVLLVLADQVSQTYTAAQYKAGNFAPDVVSAGQVFNAALLPALVLVLLYGLYALGLTGASDGTPPSRSRPNWWCLGPVGRQALLALAALLLLAGTVLGGILLGWYPPSQAAVVGVAMASMLAALRRSSPRQRWWLWAALAISALVWSLPAARVPVGLALAALAWLQLARLGLAGPVLDRAIHLTGVIFFILLGAAVYTISLKIIGGDRVIRALLDPLLARDPRLLLAALLGLMFLLGFFFEFLEIVLILVPTVCPVLFASDVNPVWVAVLMALVLQTSFLTPPFGVALFYLRAVAPPQVTTLALYRGVWPYVGLQTLVLALVWVWPGMLLG